MGIFDVCRTVADVTVLLNGLVAAGISNTHIELLARLRILTLQAEIELASNVSTSSVVSVRKRHHVASPIIADNESSGSDSGDILDEHTGELRSRTKHRRLSEAVDNTAPDDQLFLDDKSGELLTNTSSALHASGATAHDGGQVGGSGRGQFVLDDQTGVLRRVDANAPSPVAADSPDPVQHDDDLDLPRQEYYTIRAVRRRYIAKFRTAANDYIIRINEDIFEDSLHEILHMLHIVFAHILADLLGDQQQNRYGRFVIRSPNLDIPITVPMVHHSKLTAERILAAVERVAQSRKQFVLDGNLIINFIYTDIPAGRGYTAKGKRFRPKTLRVEDMLVSKRSIIQISKHDDSLCLARALYVAKVYADCNDKTDAAHLRKRQSVRQSYGKQVMGAYSLHRQCGIEVVNKAYDLEDVKCFQQKLPEYQIVVLSKDFFNAVVYYGPPQTKKLILYEADKHYHVITELNAFFSETDYWCWTCMKQYRNMREHAECRQVCNLCLHATCFNSDLPLDWKLCKDCNRFLKNDMCYRKHKISSTDKSLPVCVKYVRCEFCSRIVTRVTKEPTKHRCGLHMCGACKQWINDEVEHRCFVQPIKLDKSKDGKNKSVLYFFDFETDQSTAEHLPTLVVLVGEGTECWIFNSDNTCVTEFCDFIFSERFSNSIFVSHYGGAFDMYFVMQYLYSKGAKIETIYRDTTILQICVPQYNITLKDSYLFIPTKLSAFPSLFGFAGAKTYFPHLHKYENYVGPYLPPEEYDCDGMSSKDRAQFMEWHAAKIQSGAVFNYKADLVEYCINDCKLLRDGCMRLRDLFVSTGYTDPWAEAITLTHTCSIVFRKCFMERNTIALIPHKGYSNPKTFSVKGVKWLEYIAHKEGIDIRHARNDKEVRVLRKYWVDGLVEKDDGSRKVYEFLGVRMML